MNYVFGGNLDFQPTFSAYLEFLGSLVSKRNAMTLLVVAVVVVVLFVIVFLPTGVRRALVMA